MKCICGYTHYRDYQMDDMKKEGMEFTQGTKPFLKMLTLHTFDNQQDGYYETESWHYVYACPKCGTLKINI